MMHIDEYSSAYNISRRQVERLIDSNQLPSTKINGQRFIITPPPADAPDIEVDKFKEEIRTYVKTAGKQYVKVALKRIKEYERATGKSIRGLSNKVLYKIAAGHMPVFHKKRCDAGTVKNNNLLMSKEKVEAIAAKLYVECGEPNTKFVTTRIQEMAREEKSLYEVAAIPQTTLYAHLRKFIASNDLKSCWLYCNRHKDFLKRLPTVQGAFTDRNEFMDYIAFDDRKADVAGSWYFDEVSNKWKMRKVWYWIAIEMLTMMPLGWVILPREPNSEDVIKVLLQTMLQAGLPKKGYLFDNGIGNSVRVQKFMERVKMQSAGSGYFTRDFVPVAPYEPTHKSNIELFNRHIKKEHDVLFKNYVGGSREEVRHSGKRLMPEECDHIVEEYVKSAEAYLTGICVNRIRNKVIKSKLHKLSTSELFNKFFNKYEPYYLSEQSLRWALMDDTQIKTYDGRIRIYREGVRFDYQAADYLPALEGRKFIISMLPTNLSKMDLYATEDFIDPHTGESYEKGQYITTLDSMRELPDEELQQRVFKSRKQAMQYARKTKERLLDMALAQFPDLLDIINTQIKVNGAAIDVRKKLLERMSAITEATPLNTIAEFIREESVNISEGKTIELTTTESDSMSLTIDGEEWR